MSNSNITIAKNFSEDENMTSLSEEYDAPLKVKIIIMIFFALVILIGIVGNVVVLLLIGLVKSMHTSVNRCLFVLAVADLLILVFLPISPVGIEFLEDDSYIGERFCVFLNFYDRGAVVCSALIFFFLSVDRYFAICHPLKIRRFWSGRNTNIALIIIWVIAIASSIPYIYISTYEESKEGNSTYYYCYLTQDETWKISYDAAMSIIIFFVPIPMLVFLYGRMIVVLRRAAPGDSTEEGNSIPGRRGRLQVVIMLLSVVTIFIVCQTPFSLLILFDYYSPDMFTFYYDGINGYVTIWICRILIYVNSAANPIVYFLVSTKFREAFWVVFRCRRNSKYDHSRSIKDRQTVSTTF